MITDGSETTDDDERTVTMTVTTTTTAFDESFLYDEMTWMIFSGVGVDGVFRGVSGWKFFFFLLDVSPFSGLVGRGGILGFLSFILRTDRRGAGLVSLFHFSERNGME